MPVSRCCSLVPLTLRGLRKVCIVIGVAEWDAGVDLQTETMAATIAECVARGEVSGFCAGRRRTGYLEKDGCGSYVICDR